MRLYFDGIMFKIEQASKYRKMIGYFKIEKTQNRSYGEKQFYISPAAVSGANKP